MNWFLPFTDKPTLLRCLITTECSNITVLFEYDAQTQELVLTIFSFCRLQDGGVKKKSPPKTSGACKAPTALC